MRALLSPLSLVGDKIRQDEILKTTRVKGSNYTLVDVMEPIVRECEEITKNEPDPEPAIKACIVEVLDHISSAAGVARDMFATVPIDKADEVKQKALREKEWQKSLNGKSIAEIAMPLVEACTTAAKTLKKESASSIFVCTMETANVLKMWANDLQV
ncbi:hypothetical protein [Thermofilum sp.]|jgi:hypothetical protein|uniref:hypothetical protein n=1 Tax=Thermofilum sp. TaxID=1961369 RepID=UPI00258D8096|nr:hypothetical protein [Thermofilum sp.]